MAAEKSRILVIGGTGYTGKFIVTASARAGHPTFAIIRDVTAANPTKSKLLDEFKAAGVTILLGDLNEHESLVKAIKEVDVVISTVGSLQIADQTKIIAAIKEAGNIKRFLPSEFGNDANLSYAVEPAKSTFGVKAKIRQAIETENIPYTYISSNFFAGFFLPTIGQTGTTGPPTDKITILGDGNAKVIFNYEEDIGTYTIKAVDDPRTLNKILYLRPAANIYSHNELVTLWEKKTGKKFERVYVSEEELLKQIQVIFNYEEDIGTYTIKAVDDPRTLNKILYLRPAANIYSHNELVTLWEKKAGKKIERVYVSEAELLKQIQEAPLPLNIFLSIHHTAFVKGDHTNFEIDPSVGVEATQLYPDVKYTTVDEYLNRFL